jgi:hypothetical protein
LMLSSVQHCHRCVRLHSALPKDEPQQQIFLILWFQLPINAAFLPNQLLQIYQQYHDQGLIPFKTLSFGNGVNYTAGLDKIRTSPDHGTAYDIAGKGIANHNSFKEAVFLAIDIYNSRNEHSEISNNPLKTKEK